MSKPLNALRKFSRLRRIVSQLSLAWKPLQRQLLEQAAIVVDWATPLQVVVAAVQRVVAAPPAPGQAVLPDHDAGRLRRRGRLPVRPGIGAGIATLGDDHEPVQEMGPTRAVLVGVGRRQASMHHGHGGAAIVGREGDLDRGSSRWQPVGPGMALADQQPVGPVDGEVATADRHAVDVEGELPAGPRVQHGIVAHPAQDRGGLVK